MPFMPISAYVRLVGFDGVRPRGRTYHRPPVRVSPDRGVSPHFEPDPDNWIDRHSRTTRLLGGPRLDSPPRAPRAKRDQTPTPPRRTPPRGTPDASHAKRDPRPRPSFEPDPDNRPKSFYWFCLTCLVCVVYLS